MRATVIIPVHNAAASLSVALESLRSQTDRDFDVVIVDDCSTDGGPEMMDAFAAQSGLKVTVVRHPERRGVAAARNSGLDAAGGDRIMFLDADDILAPDAVRLCAEVPGEPDIIGWDWTHSSPGGDRYMRQPDCPDVREALEALMGGTLRWNLWLFSFRRELFDGLRFIPGLDMGEDMMAACIAFSKARSFVQIHRSLYSYSCGSGTLSRRMTEDNLRQVCGNLSKVESELCGVVPQMCINWLKLNVKLPLLVSTDRGDWRRWAACYPEADADILTERHLPLRTKVFQWMASRRLWAGVWLYNVVVYKLLLVCVRH